MRLEEIIGGNPFKNIQRLDISQEEYFAIDAYSSTDLRTLYIDRGQPYGMAQKKAGSYVESDAMLLGLSLTALSQNQRSLTIALPYGHATSTRPTHLCNRLCVMRSSQG